MWSVAILVGPLVGGTFATWGNWRGAFYAVTVAAAVLAIVALRALPRVRGGRDGAARRVPVGRVVLICAAIAVMSAASVVAAPAAKAGLFVVGVAALVAMLRLDRRAASPLFPSDAFSLGSVTGTALWFYPLGAGYMVAGASLGWTAAALAVAGLPKRWSDRMMVAGPLAMAAGLSGVALLMPVRPVTILPLLIVLTGLGIGVCWVFGVQGIMSGAKPGERDLASSSVATVQQTGLALGAAAAGIVANIAGLSGGLTAGNIANAAFWVPASFVVAAMAAAIIGGRLISLTRRAA
jgi:MFS family permease